MALSAQVQEWLRNYAQSQSWRVRPMLDADDLYQEFYLLYRECKKTARNRKLSKEHFNNYFRKACARYVIDQANLRTKAKVTAIPDDVLTTFSDQSAQFHQMELSELLTDFVRFVRANTDVTSRTNMCTPEQSIEAVIKRLNGQKSSSTHLNNLITRIGAQKIKAFVRS